MTEDQRTRFKQVGSNESIALDVLEQPIASVAALEELFLRALPSLRCPLCGNNSFDVLREFENQNSPQVVFFRPSSTDAISFVPTLALSCDDCGYVLAFAEEELRKRAERLK